MDSRAANGRCGADIRRADMSIHGASSDHDTEGETGVWRATLLKAPSPCLRSEPGPGPVTKPPQLERLGNFFRARRIDDQVLGRSSSLVFIVANLASMGELPIALGNRDLGYP